MEWVKEEDKLIGEKTLIVKFINGLSDEFSYNYNLDTIPKQIYLLINDDEKSYNCFITEYQTKLQTCKFKIKNYIDCEKELTIKVIVVC